MAKKPTPPPLPKHHLVKDGDKWKLKHEGGGRAKAVFDKKADATKGGALAGVLGKAGGSVRIHKQTGEIQEERTFPGSRDPKGSPR